jgi:hypothetical protein
MKQTGYIIRNDKGEHLYVFSKVGMEGSYPTHIGYNLTTRRVDDFKQTAPMLTVGLEELPEDEQDLLSRLIPARLALSKGTVAITAKARSGKDSMAKIIKRFFPSSSIIRALAEPIYEIDRAINGDVEGKNRESLIMIGQGLREKDPNIWIKVWLRRCLNTYFDSRQAKTKFICQDLRQPNEYQFFRNLGATIVSIKADEEKRLQKIAELDGKKDLNDKLLKDETEQNAGTYEVDYTVVNNYDDKFYVDVEKFVDSVLVAQKGW